METKKSKKADLKNKRVLFFEIGMVVAIAMLFAAFQWTTEENTLAVNLTNDLQLDFDDEWMPVNREIEKPKEEQPKQQNVDVIEIVEDIDEIEELFVPDADDNLTAAITIVEIDEEKPDETETDFFIRVEEMPVYPGGDAALMRDIMKNVVYPEIAKETGTQGKVFVRFIVNKLGKVDNVQVVRSVDPSLDKEAIRAVKLLKGWTPGKQRGKPVNVSFTVPINFRLN